MIKLRSRIITWLGHQYFARTQKKGFDLGKMSLLPKSTLLPLRRDGLDPVAALGDKRREAPISRLPLPFGMRAWLVTGYEEAKAVLGKSAHFSNDFTNLAARF